ncbi:MAG: thiamine pyrophosphate-dependent enzyme [Acidobacteriota bacterium]|nr:thiamine pyrophosphate-dependent enzyme [Acidobacteriota bacterium]
MPTKTATKSRKKTAASKPFSLVPEAAQQNMYRAIEALTTAALRRATGSEVAAIAAHAALGEHDPVLLCGPRQPHGDTLREATVAATGALLAHPDATALICGGRIGPREEYAGALRFAAQYKLPLIYLVSNSLATKDRPAPDLRTLRAEFGVPVFSVDANDAIATYRVVTEALHTSRHQRGPSFIEALTLDGETVNRKAALDLLEGYMRRHQTWQE